MESFIIKVVAILQLRRSGKMRVIYKILKRFFKLFIMFFPFVFLASLYLLKRLGYTSACEKLASNPCLIYFLVLGWPLAFLVICSQLDESGKEIGDGYDPC